MRMDKLTSRFQQALSDAQSRAVGRDHNMLEPAHVMSALLEESSGSTAPLLTQADIESFIAAHAKSPARRVTICSDRHGDGTNALLVSPPGLIGYAYGPKSFTLHCEMAREKKARLKIVSNPNLALDLDTPADLDLFNSIRASA